MKQRQRWPAELRAAIDAADAEGIPPSRIHKLAKSGELDGIDRGFPLPESTFFDILAKGRAARIASTEPVAPGEEEEVAGAILRRVLEIAKRELAKTDAALADPRKPASERAILARTLDTFRKTVRSYEHKAAPPTGGKTQQQRGGEAKSDRASNPLSDLVREHERRLDKPASPVSTLSGDDVSQSTPGDTDTVETQDTEPDVNANGHDDRLSGTRVAAGSSH